MRLQLVNASEKDSAVTEMQRRDAILALIASYTEQNSGVRRTARRALIDEGIYTQKGKLRAEFGGEPEAKAAV